MSNVVRLKLPRPSHRPRYALAPLPSPGGSSYNLYEIVDGGTGDDGAHTPTIIATARYEPASAIVEALNFYEETERSLRDLIAQDQDEVEVPHPAA